MWGGNKLGNREHCWPKQVSGEGLKVWLEWGEAFQRTKHRPNHGSVSEQNGWRSMTGNDGGMYGRDEIIKSGGAL